MVVWPGLCLTWSETPEARFSREAPQIFCGIMVVSSESIVLFDQLHSDVPYDINFSLAE